MNAIDPSTAPRIVVLGAGISGLTAAVHLAQQGYPVSVVSSAPASRSDSSSFGGGLSAAIFPPDSVDTHFNDTITGGDFLANQEPVRQLCIAAPELLRLCERLGVPFNRTEENLHQISHSEGMTAARTVYAGARTGASLLRALEGQALRYREEGLLQLIHGWDLISLVQDDDRVCRGIVIMNRANMEVKAFRSDALLVCTGGFASLFGASTQSADSDGSAVSILYRQGAALANPEFIRFDPLALADGSKPMGLSGLLLAHGARFQVEREGQDWHFVEDNFPELKNFSAFFKTSRLMHQLDDAADSNGAPKAGLDLSLLPKAERKNLETLFQKIEARLGKPLSNSPIPLAPAPSYCMGGLWVDEGQATNIPGVFAAGECQYQFHGANALDGNILLSSLFSGRKAAFSALDFVRGLEKTATSFAQNLYDSLTREVLLQNRDLTDQAGNENPYRLAAELEEWVRTHLGLVRHNSHLRRAEEKMQEFRDRFKKVALVDRGNWANRPLAFARSLDCRIELTRAVAMAALLRDETRGFHAKAEFTERDDLNFLKTTKVRIFNQAPHVEYEDVNLRYLPANLIRMKGKGNERKNIL